MNDIDYDFVRVQPMLGDCKKPEYLEKFPTGLSPAIEDGGDEGEEPFRLAEGQAILQVILNSRLKGLFLNATDTYNHTLALSGPYSGLSQNLGFALSPTLFSIYIPPLKASY